MANTAIQPSLQSLQPKTERGISVGSTYVNEGPVSLKQLEQTSGPGWREIRNPQATGGTIIFNRSDLSPKDPRKAIATARAGGDSVTKRTAQFCAATGMPLPSGQK